MVNKTEDKFTKFCKKRKWYCKKQLTHTATGHGNKQEADFLVSNKNNTWFVETKEKHINTYNFEELRQFRKLKLLDNKDVTLKSLILFHFPLLKQIVILTFEEFVNLKNNSFFKNGKLRKSFNINQIDNKYKTTWKNLEFFFE